MATIDKSPRDKDKVRKILAYPSGTGPFPSASGASASPGGRALPGPGLELTPAGQPLPQPSESQMVFVREALRLVQERGARVPQGVTTIPPSVPPKPGSFTGPGGNSDESPQRPDSDTA